MKKIWIAHLPSLGGYSIEVLGHSYAEVKDKLRKQYDEGWIYRCGGGKSFDEIMEYNGGFINELTIGKVYIDTFKN